VEVLLGVSTDTGDLLGLVKELSTPQKSLFRKVLGSPSSGSTRLFLQRIFEAHHLQKKCSLVLRSFIGTHEWEYPVFSSKTVQGKPLFKWFYEGRISEIVIPKRKMAVYSLTSKKEKLLTGAELLEQVESRIALVTKVEGSDKEWGNDFRRDAVLERWEEVLRPHAEEQFVCVTIECYCGSGTYMRTLAEKIGEAVGVPACAFSITRTDIGNKGVFCGTLRKLQKKY
jgi:tRNA U55 pseudouridine synthase TruB